MLQVARKCSMKLKKTVKLKLKKKAKDLNLKTPKKKIPCPPLSKNTFNQALLCKSLQYIKKPIYRTDR